MSDQAEDVLKSLVKDINQQMNQGREHSAIVAGLVAAGLPEAAAGLLVARVAELRRDAMRDANVTQYHGVSTAYAEVAGQAFIKGIAYIAGGGLLTLLTMAIQLPIFIVFTGAIAVGALYLLIAAWYGLRWLLSA
jgi:hypothetical protein